ncbi:type V CRISPR-associated protein Cas12a/Cpf1 [Treponema sp.]|uniref:type V CRISPR-associated protein Cas12a/Cpf1 n=1 Tax=Treponema sp. TaxID=166 RepID=UPI00388E479D
MVTINEFCGQENGYSRSITLRNKLIPIGRTQENLDKINLLDNDKKRADSYKQVKDLIDDFHRAFIQDVLSKVSFEWGPLYDEFDLFQSQADKVNKARIKIDLQKLQSVMRGKIVKQFTSDARYKKLFAKELLSELLPEIIKSAKTEEITDKQDALKVFDKFSTYFTGFHENRKNMYSDEEKSTAISFRIVNENFPKFYANVKLFEKLQKEFPNIIEETEKSLASYLNGKKLKDIFNPESFNQVLTQTGIDFYNTVIGGISAGAEKIQGLNEKINLTRQQLPDAEKNKLRGKMVVLFKQILSDRDTASFIPIGFENNDEVYDTVQKFKKETYDSVVSLVKEAFSSDNDYNLEEIFVPAKELTAFSQAIYGHWSVLSQGLFLIEESKAKKGFSETQAEKVTKEIAKKDYSLADLQKAYEKYCEKNEEQVTLSAKNYFTLKNEDEMILSKINTAYAAIDFESKKNLQAEKDSATPIKEFLDEVQNLYHYLKMVDYRGEEQKDSAFYSKLDEILTKLSEIVPLYNKVRNFVTKKVGEVKKFKLNFDCPTLADGWDENKESANDAILLKKDGKYYLGIFNPKDKPKFSKEECTEDSCYEKMVYKQFDAMKQIPKCSTQTKVVNTHFSSGSKEDLILNDKKSFIKDLIITKEIWFMNNSVWDGEKFIEKKSKDDKRFKKFQIGYYKESGDLDGYKEALSKWIDFCKDFLLSYKSSAIYDYDFKNSDEYESLDEFYNYLNLICYKIYFVNVSESKINSLVDSGKLFLFQIYNKDFAEKSTGKKNMHTLYWENLFSEENLKDICLKLNGEAELFYRPANENIKHIKHEKGSILVNRTTSDGKSIPEEIYQEIYQFKNKMRESISEETQQLLDSGTVVCKEAKHEITKDKHFTEATYLFHCPITMNFKAPEITGRKFNDRVLEALKANPDVKIIGLDRGERHLIYLSLINQKGEIEMQKTLNLVEQVRNDKTVKVNYQEKLVQKEGDRDKARKNWQTIGNIKELKEGYLSNVIHEIAKLMIDNNAIVVMEDLNFGFKRGRFAVERQVYQKFENMLIEKLNYLVFKDKAITEPGGVLNAYQLTDKSANVSDVYKQCGWLFYIPAAYTSKIDPKTGFANLFNTAGLTNVEKKKGFFDKFDGIRYDSKEDCFVFTVDYSKFGDNADYFKKWDIYTRGERIVYSRKENKTFTVSPTENLKKKFDEFGVNWHNEENFIDSLQTVQAEKANASFFDELLRSFNTTLQMRNSIPNSEIDYLISPVKADDGTFFDSREQLAFGKEAKLPVDADANGAYHIALKGLYLLQNDFNRDEKGVIQNIKNVDWFRFVQEKEYKL